MTAVIRVSKDEHVATVTLNRPDKHNAVNLDMFAALADAGSELAADKSVRAVVLEGAGESFCAGIDLEIFQQGDMSSLTGQMAAMSSSPANVFQRAAYVWREIQVPVFCAIHGATFGAGLQIALGADLRYAAPDSRLSVMEIKWGIIPDMAISKTLTRIVPVDRAKELAWTGRVIDAEEALRLGIVSTIADDPAQVARESARSVAARSPSAVRAIKRLFDESAEMSVAEAFRLEAELQLSLLGGAHQLEAVQANLQKRPAKFDD